MKFTHLIATFVFTGMITFSCPAEAEVRLPKIFGDHMVLQRDQPIPVWGWADPNEKIIVELDTNSVSTIADTSGKWMVKLPALKTGKPRKLVVKGSNTITINDVLLGEVWVCSGQSNMEWSVASSNNPEKEKAAANFPMIRHIKIPRRPNGFPQQDVEAQWTVCSPETVSGYTAVGYFFGRKLHQELDVPVGLINSSWGGTLIEPWTPPVGFESEEKLTNFSDQVKLTNPSNQEYQKLVQNYLNQLDQWLAESKKNLDSEKPLSPVPGYPEQTKPLTSHQSPTTLYNGMIHPLVPYGIRGAIWYQGESNHRDGILYYHKMRALINGWRKVWGQGEFPFYFVQIAPYQYGSESPYILPTLWEAQNKSLEIPSTGQAVIHDIGNLKDIHPRNKQDVGARLALIAMAKTYHRPKTVYSGPTFKSLKVEGAKLRITFEHTGSGLASRDGKPLDWFEIIGNETDFVPAKAVIEGNSIVLSSPEVKQAAAMRFAWHKLAEPNLMNKEGLPAAPFRAGKIPQRDWLSLKVDEAKKYRLIYDLDLSKLSNSPQYDVDRSKDSNLKFDRIAYFLELKKPATPVEYIYVSMDAFTDNLSHIAIPTFNSKAIFQKNVSNLNIVSNVKEIAAGTGIKQGNIEFWPHNYGPQNSSKIPNANNSLFDFGDSPGAPENGYGSMQIHHHEAKQTLFAINKWNSGNSADIGIGNSKGQTRDWTFKSNASQFEVKRLRILVLPR